MPFEIQYQYAVLAVIFNYFLKRIQCFTCVVVVFQS